jgi:hypothetical protein
MLLAEVEARLDFEEDLPPLEVPKTHHTVAFRRRSSCVYVSRVLPALDEEDVRNLQPRGGI